MQQRIGNGSMKIFILKMYWDLFHWFIGLSWTLLGSGRPMRWSWVEVRRNASVNSFIIHRTYYRYKSLNYSMNIISGLPHSLTHGQGRCKIGKIVNPLNFGPPLILFRGGPKLRSLIWGGPKGGELYKRCNKKWGQNLREKACEQIILYCKQKNVRPVFT